MILRIRISSQNNTDMKIFSFVIFFALIFSAVPAFCRYVDDEIQYSYKYVADTKGDGFADSLATSYNKLAIGAPQDTKGYVILEPNTKIRPPQGDFFGKCMDMNQNFLVVGGFRPSFIYVYSSSRPYELKDKINVENNFYPSNVKLLDDNSIVVTGDYPPKGLLSVYRYDGKGSWNLEQTIALDHIQTPEFNSLAVSGSVIAFGLHTEPGQVSVYSKEKEGFIETAAIHSSDSVSSFGGSVAMDGQHLAVSSDNYVFTYQYDSDTKRWNNNGKLLVPGSARLSLQNDTLAATVMDWKNQPEVCAYVYKVTKNKKNRINLNNNNDDCNINKKNSTDVSNSIKLAGTTWLKIATLKTNGFPLGSGQTHNAISVDNHLVFTGRIDYDGFGMVFVHNISKHSYH